MMVSAVACIIGNIAYCLSFDAKSLTLLVIARLITGFGKDFWDRKCILHTECLQYHSPSLMHPFATSDFTSALDLA